MGIERISFRYAGLIILLGIFKGTVDIKITQKNVKLGSYFWIFNSQFELSTPLELSFSDNFGDKFNRNKSEIC